MERYSVKSVASMLWVAFAAMIMLTMSSCSQKDDPSPIMDDDRPLFILCPNVKGTVSQIDGTMVDNVSFAYIYQLGLSDGSIQELALYNPVLGYDKEVRGSFSFKTIIPVQLRGYFKFVDKALLRVICIPGENSGLKADTVALDLTSHFPRPISSVEFGTTAEMDTTINFRLTPISDN